MKFLKLFIISIFAACGLFACTGGTPKRREFIIADSKSYEASLFRQNCAVCHGAEANGKESNGALIPSLRYGKAANLSEAEIYNQIHDGKLPMPSFKNQLTEKEIRGMVNFIMYDLQGREKLKAENGN